VSDVFVIKVKNLDRF